MVGAEVDDVMPRAKRLKMLREAKARKDRGESNNGEEGVLVAAVLKPAKDDPIQEGETLQPKKQDEDTNMSDASATNDDHSEDLVKKVARVQEDDAKTEDESDDELLNLAPTRANWDMERDIAPMLRKLERRTQHAIVEILRERLAAEQQEEGSDDGDEEDEDDDDDEVDE